MRGLSVLKAQVSTNEYATMGGDILTYGVQLPIGSVFNSQGTTDKGTLMLMIL